MSKVIEDTISKRYGTTLWAEIRKLYESKQQHEYERIKTILTAEFDLTSFPAKRTVERHAKDEKWKRYIAVDTVKKLNKTYTEAFWINVRAIYESNPKISYKRLKEYTQNELKCSDFPSPDAINAKAENEGWKRLNQLIEKSDVELRKLSKSVTSMAGKSKINFTNNGRNVVIDQGCDDGEDEDYLVDFHLFNDQVENVKSNIKNLLMESAVKQRKMSETIIKNRKRIGSIGEIGDMLSDRLMLNHTLLMSQQIRELSGAVEFIEKENKILSKTINTFNELTFGRRESLKLELQMYGVGIDDLRIVDTAERVKGMNDDKAYEEQRARLLAEREMIAKRHLYIQSGGLERDTQEEMKRRMELAEINNDGDEYEGLVDYDNVVED